MVPGMRKCKLTPHGGCFLTVVVTCRPVVVEVLVGHRDLVSRGRSMGLLVVGRKAARAALRLGLCTV